MEPKQASDILNEIAKETEATGTVPLAKVTRLLAAVEGRGLRASVPAAQAATAFREMATLVTTKPSRTALANMLRNVIADQMMPTSAQVAAMIYQTANSREDVMKGFHESNPSMSQDELEKAADMWEKHKNVVKDKHA